VRNFNGSGAFKLIEVFFGPARRAGLPLPWRAAPQLAEGPAARKPPQVAPAAELLREERSGATGVSRRRPEVG
jgi:hypothetical protein